MRVGIYTRVSTHDQQTLPLQLEDLREYAAKRGWSVSLEIAEVGSGAKTRPRREELLKAVRRREIDAVLVWRLDRWGRSLADLIVTLKELSDLGIGFISLGEALDLTTPSGRAMAGMLAVFAEFEREIMRERVKAGIANAKANGKCHGRPPRAREKTEAVKNLSADGCSQSEIARRLGIGRTSVKRILRGLQ